MAPINYPIWVSLRIVLTLTNSTGVLVIVE